MSSEIKADKWSPASGTSATLGDSGDTFTIPSGATITNSGTATGFGDTNYFSTTGFSTYLSGTQSIASATESTVTFNTERFDMGSNFNTSTYIYETPTAGKYFFQFGMLLHGNSDTVLTAANVGLKKDDGAGNFSTNQDWENISFWNVKITLENSFVII